MALGCCHVLYGFTDVRVKVIEIIFLQYTFIENIQCYQQLSLTKTFTLLTNSLRIDHAGKYLSTTLGPLVVQIGSGRIKQNL